jgi:hypothetical protein
MYVPVRLSFEIGVLTCYGHCSTEPIGVRDMLPCAMPAYCGSICSLALYRGKKNFPYQSGTGISCRSCPSFVSITICTIVSPLRMVIDRR